jgi:hypothetical protein
MTEPLSPEVLAWLRQSVLADGSTYSRVLLHLLERVEALEARLIPGAAQPPAAPPAPPTSPEAAYDLSRQQATTQPPTGWLDQHGPQDAPPAGELVEGVALVFNRSCPRDEYVIKDCRAAIRVVAAWLDQRGATRLLAAAA